MRQHARKRNGTARKNREVEDKPPIVRAPKAGPGQHTSSQIFHLLGEKQEKRAEHTLATEVQIPDLPDVSGTGPAYHESLAGGSLRLEGRTDATFDGGAYETQNVRVARGSGCACGEGEDCLHVTGTLVARYHVTTTVTLPSVSDFPNLTACQRARVQDAITNILAPHEQQHVQAFRTYNGITRRRFDLTLCRSDFDSTIDSMFQTETSARESSARAASAALDPFHFDVDLDCEDERSSYLPEPTGSDDDKTGEA
jgi:hypothetical protein